MLSERKLEKQKENQNEYFKGYKIVCIGEGGGAMYDNEIFIDRSVVRRYPLVEDKEKKGADIYSLEILSRRPMNSRLSRNELHEKYAQFILNWHEDGLPTRKFVYSLDEEIPFDTNSIDELYIENVIGDPNPETRDEKLYLVMEIIRVLKPGGFALLLDTYTPDIADYEQIKKIFYKDKDQFKEHVGGDFEIIGPLVYGPELIKLFMSKEFGFKSEDQIRGMLDSGRFVELILIKKK